MVRRTRERSLTEKRVQRRSHSQNVSCDQRELEWYSEPGYDVVEEKTCCSISGIVEGGHGFCPFGEVIDSDNNVFVTIAGRGITGHKINAPFAEGAGSDHRVQKSGGARALLA
jgi:hypothetical protein